MTTLEPLPLILLFSQILLKTAPIQLVLQGWISFISDTSSSFVTCLGPLLRSQTGTWQSMIEECRIQGCSFTGNWMSILKDSAIHQGIKKLMNSVSAQTPVLQPQQIAPFPVLQIFNAFRLVPHPVGTLAGIPIRPPIQLLLLLLRLLPLLPQLLPTFREVSFLLMGKTQGQALVLWPAKVPRLS